VMKCVDASFIIRLVINNYSDNIYSDTWQQWQDLKTIIVAPTLTMYEVSNGFYRYQRIGQITSNQTEDFLTEALNLDIQFYGDTNLHQEALVLANLYSLPATYDAHYLALAQRLQIELWTADKKLFNSVFKSLSWVKLI